jgi:hypothetical protein
MRSIPRQVFYLRLKALLTPGAGNLIYPLVVYKLSCAEYVISTPDTLVGGHLRTHWILPVVILSLIFTGCAPAFSQPLEQDENKSSALPSEKPGSSLSPAPSMQGDNPSMSPSPTPLEPGLQPIVDAAIADLAQRLSIPPTQINLVDARSVVWPDSSLGCPQPGMLYLQVPEDGALIVLQVVDTLYEYHFGGNRGLFLCERNIKEPASNPKLDIFNLTPSKSDPPPTTPDNSIPPGEDT